MEKEITKKLYEILHKCRIWVDNQQYILPEFRQKSWSDEFMEKIILSLKEEMIRQKLSSQLGISIPTHFRVEINELDSQEWSGVKREILLKELNSFIKEMTRILSSETSETALVEVVVSSQIVNRGEIKITHSWAESYAPTFHSCKNSSNAEFEEFSEDTISAPAFWKDDKEILEDDYETIVKSNPSILFSLEIWRNGVQQNISPIFQNKITIGRSINQDIPLQGDLEISRHHAILIYQRDSQFSLIANGQNPILIKQSQLFKNQTMSFRFGEPFQIGSYLLRTRD